MEKNNVLLVTIVDRGFADSVMEVVRERGATGGTIIHGRGSGTKEMAKFFNIILHEEKEVVLIVSSQENKNNIMDGILRNAGLATDAHGIVFTLPVEDFKILSKFHNVETPVIEKKDE